MRIILLTLTALLLTSCASPDRTDWAGVAGGVKQVQHR